MSRFPHLAQRIFNKPVAIAPEKAEVIVAALAQRLGVTSMIRLNGQVLAFDDDDDGIIGGIGEEAPADSAYGVVAGVAVIPVEGTLVQKLGTLRPYSGMTGYDGIRQNFLVALDDPGVRAIVFDIDSPGGEVAGMFDLADTVYGARSVKPIWAILSENAYSAAYLLASACSRVTVPRTGGAGSIGIITMHVDISAMLDREGVKVTMVHYGARKADGADTAPLSTEALRRAQADIDALGAMFDAQVARNRGIAASRVKSYQAGTFMGQAAVTARLADAVMAPDHAFRALLATLDQ